MAPSSTRRLPGAAPAFFEHGVDGAQLLRMTAGRAGTDLGLTQGELGEIVEKHNFESMLQGSYQHMLDRMQRDLIAYQIQANDRLEGFRSKRQILDDETEKNRQAKQEKTQNHKQMRDQIK